MATTITVPSGTGSTSVSLTFATSATAALATSLLSSVYAAAATGSLNNGGVEEFVVTTSGAYTVPAGVNTIVDAATGPVTITASPVAPLNPVYSVVAGAGNLEFIATGGSGTIVAGPGTDTIVGNNFSVLGDATWPGFLGGSDTVTTGTFLMTGASPSITAVGAGATIFGSASASNGDVMINDGTGPNVFIIDAGSTTVNALSAGGTYFQTSGTLEFLNAGSSTVVGSASSGASTLFGGTAALSYWQGADTASVLYSGGSSISYLISGAAGGIMAFAGAGSTIDLLNTQANTAYNYLVGGAGSDTLIASLASGAVSVVGGSGTDIAYLSNISADTFAGGSGSATVVGGTSGSAALPDLFSFANGSAGGNDVIMNFGSGSQLVFTNYGAAGDAAIKSAIAAAGSGTTVSFSLPDSTKITLIGVNGAIINPSSNTTSYS